MPQYCHPIHYESVNFLKTKHHLWAGVTLESIPISVANSFKLPQKPILRGIDGLIDTIERGTVLSPSEYYTRIGAHHTPQVMYSGSHKQYLT